MKKSIFLYLAMAMLAVCFSSFALTSCGDDDEGTGEDVYITNGLVYSGEFIGDNTIRLLSGSKQTETPLQKGVVIRVENNPFTNEEIKQGGKCRFYITKAIRLYSEKNENKPQFSCAIQKFDIFEMTGDWIEGTDGCYKARVLPYRFGFDNSDLYDLNTEIEIIADLIEVPEGSSIPQNCTICFDRKDLNITKFIPSEEDNEEVGDIVSFKIKRYIKVLDKRGWLANETAIVVEYFCEVMPCE